MSSKQKYLCSSKQKYLCILVSNIKSNKITAVNVHECDSKLYPYITVKNETLVKEGNFWITYNYQHDQLKGILDLSQLPTGL